MSKNTLLLAVPFSKLIKESVPLTLLLRLPALITYKPVASVGEVTSGVVSGCEEGSSSGSLGTSISLSSSLQAQNSGAILNKAAAKNKCLNFILI